MPVRPVTNPSISAAIRKAGMTPMTTSTASLASSASAVRRYRSPGSTSDQPMRRPAPPAMQIAMSSRKPCGSTSAQKISALPAAWNAPARRPINAAFWTTT
jgi:hypothetical protein